MLHFIILDETIDLNIMNDSPLRSYKLTEKPLKFIAFSLFFIFMMYIFNVYFLIIFFLVIISLFLVFWIPRAIYLTKNNIHLNLYNDYIEIPECILDLIAKSKLVYCLLKKSIILKFSMCRA